MRKPILNILRCSSLYLRSLCRSHAITSTAQVENTGNFSLEETQGQPWKLFLSPVDTAIAHSVSCDFQMDKGIAKQFLKQYGNFNELIEKGLDFPEGREVGKIGVLQTKERFVYYLITRPKWWDSSTLRAMEQSLHSMQSHCIQNNVKRLAIPRIGAHYDRLEWDKVRGLITDIFQHSNITITAYTHR
ncbi:ADP-ribose glycohydrolase OARD1-like [Dendronephthya gigantea]|uniref:ADP-ribose glycohydrolase OARD1-like n=1 Tax=Dendronephthya gigantea TaxID=151771 RepID=UPI00106A7CE4|nr:ADP-ribose glycohydrolase OARD1-like [Dendronephthya gigantea]